MGKTDCNIYDKATISSMYKEFLQISKKTNKQPVAGKNRYRHEQFPCYPYMTRRQGRPTDSIGQHASSAALDFGSNRSRTEEKTFLTWKLFSSKLCVPGIQHHSKPESLRSSWPQNPSQWDTRRSTPTSPHDPRPMDQGPALSPAGERDKEEGEWRRLSVRDKGLINENPAPILCWMPT